MATNATDAETYNVIGAAMEVHSELGPGFLESVYREALCIVFDERSIPHRKEVPVPLYFRGRPLAVSFRLDLVCFDSLLIELKALRLVGGRELAQTINYLKASRLRKALLLNFGTTRLQYRRVVR